MPSPKQYADGLVNFSKGPDYGFGTRRDNPNQNKAMGFYGKIPLPNGDFSTEYSTKQDIDGKGVEMPLLLPGLTKDEFENVKMAASTGSPLLQSVYDKAREHAVMRMGNKQSPFWGIPEAYNPMPE